MKTETTLQWAIRTAREKRENELLNNPQPPAPTPPTKFVRVDFGYFDWAGGYDAYFQTLKKAYEWGIKNKKSNPETAKKFNVNQRNLYQFFTNRKLPKLKVK
jgi:hypothetical protein